MRGAMFAIPDGAACRSCGGADLTPVLDLGRHPLSDRLRSEAQLAEPTPRYPLQVVFCGACGLLQILETVDPAVVFGDDYPYFSSVSDALVAHARENVARRIADLDLGPDSLAVELASNDGYLLQHYRDRGVPVLGIDPVPGPVAAAVARGIPTRREFFTLELAGKLRAEGVAADVIHANNVLAHVADTNGFTAGIALLLKPGGEAVIEVPYVRDLIAKRAFDTIYHEHLCYFSVTALDALFRRHGLHLNEVERLAVHGGSLRLRVGREDRRGDSVRGMLAAEKADGLDRPGHYLGFARAVAALRDDLLRLLGGLKDEGRRLAAYGAAAKGSTLLEYCGIGPELLDFVVDLNPHKQGLWMPGRDLPVLPPAALLERRPDDVLLLTWNFADEILAQQRDYLAAGGRFVVPVPEPRIVAHGSGDGHGG